MKLPEYRSGHDLYPRGDPDTSIKQGFTLLGYVAGVVFFIFVMVACFLLALLR